MKKRMAPSSSSSSSSLSSSIIRKRRRKGWLLFSFMMINLGAMVINLSSMYLRNTTTPTPSKQRMKEKKKKESSSGDNTNNDNDDAAVRLHYSKAQEEFQMLLQQLQFGATAGGRTLVVPKRRVPLPGFALELQMMGRYLQIAMATRRQLQISEDWSSAYAISDCTTTGWACLWQPISSSNTTTDTTTELVSSYGIISDKDAQKEEEEISTSTYFNIHYYGTRHKEVTVPNWPWNWKQHIDVIPYWERHYGRYWIRSQMVHFLWERSNQRFKTEITTRTPSQLTETKTKTKTNYIGFHIRTTDNIQDLQRDFKRNGTLTRNFQRFMTIAETIREQQSPLLRLNTIYLATDHQHILQDSQEYTNWNFIWQTAPVDRMQTNTSATTAPAYEWFKTGRSSAAGAIATDIDILRRAQFLIGSHQSNVYRLATELNTAYYQSNKNNNNNHHPTQQQQQRHFTVDIEWFEDP